jgi:hypothetical protein
LEIAVPIPASLANRRADRRSHSACVGDNRAIGWHAACLLRAHGRQASPDPAQARFGPSRAVATGMDATRLGEGCGCHNYDRRGLRNLPLLCRLRATGHSQSSGGRAARIVRAHSEEPAVAVFSRRRIHAQFLSRPGSARAGISGMRPSLSGLGRPPAGALAAATLTIVMETLKGFPNLPAMVRAEQSSAAPHAIVMETLGGFPNPRHLPPALPPPRFARPRAMVRAEQSSAAPHAIVMETLGGFPNPRHLPPTLPPPRFARPRAMVRAEQSSAAPHACD